MTVVLRVDNLAKTYRKPFTRKKVEAVRGVSFEVRLGEIFGFLGPNGAGKTTAVKLLLGLLAPTSGEAWVLGQRIGDLRTRRRIRAEAQEGEYRVRPVVADHPAESFRIAVASGDGRNVKTDPRK